MAEFTLPNAVQFDHQIDKPSQLAVKNSTLEMKLDSVSQKQTLVAGSNVEIGGPLASRNRLVIRNLDEVRTARIGASGITEKLGYLLEPLEELLIEFDTSNAVSVYGRATGGELVVEVIES